MSNRFYSWETAHRFLSFALCVLLAIISPLTSLAAGQTPGRQTLEEPQAAESWIVPIEQYRDWNILEGEVPQLYGALSNKRIQILKNALVTKKTDGSYRVRLIIPGYSAYESVQVISAEKNEEAWRYFKENKIVANAIPIGNFDPAVPTSQDECQRSDKWEDLQERITSDETINSWFLKESELKKGLLEGTERDRGYLEFDLESLDDMVTVVPCYSRTVDLYSVLVGFDEANKRSVPAELTVSEGTYTMGLQWTDYAEATGTAGNRESDSSVLELLNSLIESEVSVNVEKDGSLKAEFKINNELFSETQEDPVTKIEIVKKRDTSVEANKTNNIYTNAWNEILCVSEWQAYEREEGTVSLSFADLTDSYMVRISTKSTDEYNNKTASRRKNPSLQKYVFGNLTLVQNAEEVTEVVQESNGAVLKTDSLTFKDGYTFVCENSAAEISDPSFLVPFTKSGTEYIVYSYAVKDSSGKDVALQSKTTIDLPIPEHFNVATTSFYYFEKNGQAGVYGTPSDAEVLQNEEGKWVLRITPADWTRYQYAIEMFDSGAVMTAAEYEELIQKGTDKYYSVRTTIANLSSNIQPSMAAGAVKADESILHVTEDGDLELYLTFQGVLALGSYGFLKDFYYNNQSQEQTMAEVLAYKTVADLSEVEKEQRLEPPEMEGVPDEENLNIDALTEKYNCHYVQTVMIRPEIPAEKDKYQWRVSFVVPFMNEATITGTAEDMVTAQKTAFLRVISGSAKEVDASAVPKPNNSLLLGTIEDAKWQYEKLTDEAQKSALEAAINTATEIYEKLKTAFDADTLKQAVEDLKAVISGTEAPKFPDGQSQVDIEILDHNGEVSEYQDYFETLTDLTVADGTMSLTLKLKADADISIASITFGEEPLTPVYDGENRLLGFTLSIPYTEDAIELKINLEGSMYPEQVSLRLTPHTADTLESLKAEAKALMESLDASEYETTSYNSLKAVAEAIGSLSADSTSYELTDETVTALAEALEAEKQALVKQSDMQALAKERLLAMTPFVEELRAELEDELRAELEEEADEEEDADRPDDSQSQTESKPEGSGSAETGEESGKDESTDTSEAEDVTAEDAGQADSGEESAEPEDTDADEAEDEDVPEADAQEPDEDTEEPEDSSEDTEEPEEDASEEEDSDTDEAEPGISISARRHWLLTAPKATESNAVLTATPANAVNVLNSGEYDIADMPTGVYTVDFILWQFAQDDVSMGNGAVKDSYDGLSGKQVKLEVTQEADGKHVYAYLEFQKMTYALGGENKTGHLLEMVIMDNLKMTEAGTIESFKAVDPVYSEYTDETDDYGPGEGKKYPSLLKFDITKYVTTEERSDRVPVQVNVPVMGTSARQPAYLRFYWNTIEPVSNLSDIDISTLEDAIRMAEEKLYAADASWLEGSRTAMESSLAAARTLRDYVTVGEDGYEIVGETAERLVNRRVTALQKTMAAMIETNDENVRKGPLSAAIRLADSLTPSDFEEETWEPVETYLASAQEINRDMSAKQEQVDEAVTNLLDAMTGLERKPDSGQEKDKVDVPDGYYSVRVRLWHSVMDKASMGDPAIEGKAYVHIEGEDATMRLVTKKMTTSGITTHLYDFFVEDSAGKMDTAELISTENQQWVYEFELPSVGENYYDVEVDPRVDVMGTDPVPARLKVTWSRIDTITQGQWDDLEGDVNYSDGKATSSIHAVSKLKDETTGVSVTGNTGGPGVIVESERLESGETFDKAQAAVADVASQLAVWDIRLRSGEDYVQPQEPVTLKVPIPTAFDTERLLLYRIEDDGTKTLLEGQVNGSYYEAAVDHFSIYVLVESSRPLEEVLGTAEPGQQAQAQSQAAAAAATAANADGGQTAVPQEVDGRVVPYTGDDTPVELMTAAAFGALVILAATFLPRRRKKDGKVR